MELMVKGADALTVSKLLSDVSLTKLLYTK